jgi:hypothetical protein
VSFKDEMLGRLDSFRRFGSTATVDPSLQGEEKTRAEMARNRAINHRKTAATGGTAANRSGADISFATGRPRDPLFYWRQNNLPYDFADPDELRKIRLYSRLLYLTHPMIASCIDIYSKFPLLGMELRCKDDKLTEFYTDLFLGEDALNYEEFCLDIGREYWTVGEAWPFATFNEKLGIWDSEELLNADDVEVQRSPFMKDPRYFIKLPETIRRVLNDRQPAWEYTKLVQSYPELVHYGAEDARMPVSNVLLQQLRFKADTFNSRGVPILTRAMRAVIQEEMLNSAVDAIADRLYTPLILARLGASATDLGTDQPWIPSQDQLADFEEALDAALAADFRALVYHFAVQIEPVFGREQMPDLSGDFDRLEDRILQTFGLSKTMLTGADAGETYAADALNRDLIAQLLTTYQKMIVRHYRKRALIVAEAQEHYDYEERNGKRYVVTEEILETDEETGEERIVEQPKLLIPDMQMRTMNLRDEETERQFLEALAESGVPVSIKTRLTNIPISFEDEVERRMDEQVDLAVAEQETRKRQYQALRDANLPIPQDLKNDFEPMPMNMQTPDSPMMRTPTMGMDPTGMFPNIAPTQQDMAAVPAGQPVPSFPQAQVPGTPVIPMQQPELGPGDGGDDGKNRPPESDEQRGDMPKKKSSLQATGDLWKRAKRMRGLAEEHVERPDLTERIETIAKIEDEAERTAAYKLLLEEANPQGGDFGTPTHIGMRRHALDGSLPDDMIYESEE